MDHNKHAAHTEHQGHDAATFKRKFVLCLLLTIPAVGFSPTVLSWLGVEFAGSLFVSAFFGIIIYFYGGWVFIRGAKTELATRAPGMMTLIALAITVAFAYSLAVTFNLISGMDFWWELATLVTIMLLGHWLEMLSIAKASGALTELTKLLPSHAELISGEHIMLDQLKVGDVVLVRPGGSIPADGEVQSGESDVNEAMITGESKPINKTKHAPVIGGTLNGSGALTIKITKVGSDTALAAIIALVAEALNSKSRTQILADKAARVLTIVALSAAVITAGVWAALGASTSFVLERAVAVLIIACPHALGLAIPLVTSISTTLAAKNGILIRRRSALESARTVQMVLFDKTGTLTTGKQQVIDGIATRGDSSQLLALAAAVESQSEHAIAKAIVAHAKQTNISVPRATHFAALAGSGAKATVAKTETWIGNDALVNEQRAKIPRTLQTQANKIAREDKTVVYVVQNKNVIGIIGLADTIRAESAPAVTALQSMHKQVAIVTGDSEGATSWVSKQLGNITYFANVLPKGKIDVIKQQQSSGKSVAMVGDGVNDAPALAQADIGIAIGAGTDVAIASADIILVSGDPRGVAKTVRLSALAYKKMVQNLAWAVGYNVVAMPLAAGALFGIGFLPSPALSAIVMSASTIIVALNAQLLRRTQL